MARLRCYNFSVYKKQTKSSNPLALHGMSNNMLI